MISLVNQIALTVGVFLLARIVLDQLILSFAGKSLYKAFFEAKYQQTEDFEEMKEGITRVRDEKVARKDNLVEDSEEF